LDADEFKEVVARLKEVNEVISSLDEAIRAAGFAVLRPYIVGGTEHQREEGQEAVITTTAADTTDAESFFTAHPEGKPADNVILIAAYLYSQYGSEPFSLDDVRGVANSTGLTIPARPDMTIRACKRNGKTLFRTVGYNQYSPTVHGEAYFKTTLGVQKGTKQRASGENG